MGKGILLWLLGVPIPVIIILWLLFHHLWQSPSKWRDCTKTWLKGNFRALTTW